MAARISGVGVVLESILGDRQWLLARSNRDWVRGILRSPVDEDYEHTQIGRREASLKDSAPNLVSSRTRPRLRVGSLPTAADFPLVLSYGAFLVTKTSSQLLLRCACCTPSVALSAHRDPRFFDLCVDTVGAGEKPARHMPAPRNLRL